MMSRFGSVAIFGMVCRTPDTPSTDIPCHFQWCESTLSKMTLREALRAVSEVSAQICNFSFFWAFRGSKMTFWSNFAGGTRSNLSFSFSKMSLNLKSIQNMVVQIIFRNAEK